ncbi:MAG: class I SAM-dependent methyltransferase [Spirochaetes bacterium]|nr:class I SAM-dependent methyltransferase [Spirochaetota bacterium]
MPEFGLVKCNNCGLIFFEETQDIQNSKTLYRDLYNEDIGYKQHKRQEQQIKKGIQPRLGYNKKIILSKIINEKRKYSIAEIGAGVGVVASYLIKEGHKYTGFEINEEIAYNATKQGLQIKHTGYHGLVDYNKEFDAVLAFEVLEHIDNLDECFRLIVKSLSSNGLLGFTVPNSNKFRNYEEIQTRLFQSSPPVHLNFFNCDNIQNILNLYKLEPVFL